MRLKIIHICDCTKLFQGCGEFRGVGTAIIKAVTNRANSWTSSEERLHGVNILLTDMQKEIWNGSKISILATTINVRFKKLRVVQSNNTPFTAAFLKEGPEKRFIPLFSRK